MLAQGLDRDDVMALGLRGQHRAGIDGLAIQQDRVRAGEALFVPELDAVETEPPQGDQQGFGGGGLVRMLCGVNVEGEVHD